MTRFQLDLRGKLEEFTVTRQGTAIRVCLEGNEVTCRIIHVEDAFFDMEVRSADGKRRLIHAAGTADGDSRQLWVNGETVSYGRIHEHNKEIDHVGSLAATIPAIVTQILVNPGDRVSIGDKLVLLESMKMIIPIQSPYNGIITAVYCQEGDSVQAGVQLIEIEDEGEG